MNAARTEKTNAARTKNKTALCEVRSRESDGTGALLIAQRSRESLFIPTRARLLIGRGGVVLRRLPLWDDLLQFPL